MEARLRGNRDRRADRKGGAVKRDDYYADNEQPPRREGPPRCPHCGRVMSNREAAEQAACNDCTDHYGGSRL